MMGSQKNFTIPFGMTLKIHLWNRWKNQKSLNIFALQISLATRVRKVLSNLVDSRQTAYVNERFIGESGRLIDDVIKVCDIQKISGYLLTVDFEKAFDSLNHKFLIAVLKNTVLVKIYWLDQNFIKRPRILRN